VQPKSKTPRRVTPKLDFGHFWPSLVMIERDAVRDSPLSLRLRLNPKHQFGVEMPDDWLFKTAQVKLARWMASFGDMFTASTWQRVLVLLIGAVLSPGRRTVAVALRVTGLDQDPSFTNYHRVLNRGRWSSCRVARHLFCLLVNTFVPSGPVITGLDDTLERRWGAKIAARGIYRDPTRSSHGHFVKASGLRWLSVMLLPEIAFAGRV